MKKYFKYLFCVVISMMCFVFNVDAETTTTTSEDKTCNYASRAYLNSFMRLNFDFPTTLLGTLYSIHLVSKPI